LAKAALQMRNFVSTLSANVLSDNVLKFQAALVRDQVAGVYDRRFSVAQNFELWGVAYERAIHLISSLQKNNDDDDADFTVSASENFFRKLSKQKFRVQKCHSYVCLVDCVFDNVFDNVRKTASVEPLFWQELAAKLGFAAKDAQNLRKRIFVSEFSSESDDDDDDDDLSISVTSEKDDDEKKLEEVDYTYTWRPLSSESSENSSASQHSTICLSNNSVKNSVDNEEAKNMGWFELTTKKFCRVENWPYVTYKRVFLSAKQQEHYVHDNRLLILASHFLLLAYYVSILLVDVGVRLHLNLNLFSAQHVVFLLFVFGSSTIFVACNIVLLVQVRRVRTANTFFMVLVCTLCALLPAVHLCIAAPFTEVNDVFFGLLVAIRQLSFFLLVFTLLGLPGFQFLLVFVCTASHYALLIVENAWLANVVSVDTSAMNAHDWLALFAFEKAPSTVVALFAIFILAIKLAVQRFVLQSYFLIEKLQVYTQLQQDEQREIQMMQERRTVSSTKKNFVIFCCLDQQEYESFRQIFGAQHEKCTRFFDELQQQFAQLASHENAYFCTSFHGVYTFLSDNATGAVRLASILQSIIAKKMAQIKHWLPAGVDALHSTIIVHDLKDLCAKAPGLTKMGTHVWDVSLDQCFLLLFYLNKPETDLLVCTQQVAECCPKYEFEPHLSVDLYEEDETLCATMLATYSLK